MIGIAQKAVVEPNNRSYAKGAVLLRGIGGGCGDAASAGGGVEIATALEVAVGRGDGRFVVKFARRIGGKKGREGFEIGKEGGVW